MIEDRDKVKNIIATDTRGRERVAAINVPALFADVIIALLEREMYIWAGCGKFTYRVVSSEYEIND